MFRDSTFSKSSKSRMMVPVAVRVRSQKKLAMHHLSKKQCQGQGLISVHLQVIIHTPSAVAHEYWQVTCRPW